MENRGGLDGNSRAGNRVGAHGRFAVRCRFGAETVPVNLIWIKKRSRPAGLLAGTARAGYNSRHLPSRIGDATAGRRTANQAAQLRPVAQRGGASDSSRLCTKLLIPGGEWGVASAYPFLGNGGGHVI
jgi:hypothetical protein